MKRIARCAVPALCSLIWACSDDEPEPVCPTVTDAASEGGGKTDAASDIAPDGGGGDVDSGGSRDTSTPDGPDGSSGFCDNVQLVLGCRAGRCTLTSSSTPLPVGTAVQLTEKALPTDLAQDAIAPALCTVTLPTGVSQVNGLTLSMQLDGQADPQATLFLSGVVPRQVSASGPSNSQVAGLITSSGDYGATKRPAPWKVDGFAGVDQISSQGQAALLHNVSSGGVTAAYFDGTRLFVGQSLRVLVFNGLPNDPSVVPALVLGQPDLQSELRGTSSSLLGTGGIGAIWSDGTRLVVGNGNRVLIWQQMPTQSYTPADIVLGQPDFSSNVANNGGVSASSLNNVQGIDSDGTRLYVGDLENHRLLVWNTFPERIRQPADFVVGQPTFNTNAPLGGATGFNQVVSAASVPNGLFVSGYFTPGVVHFPLVTANNPTGDFLALSEQPSIAPGRIYTAGGIARVTGAGMAMRDSALNRIIVTTSVPTAPVSTGYFVLGQPDIYRSVAMPVSASSVHAGLTMGAGSALVVPDSNRLLIWDSAPTYTFEPAARIVGQAGFTTNFSRVDYRGISGASLAQPADIAVGGGKVAIADRGNNRVLIFDETALGQSNATASVVLGQPDDKSYVPNLDQRTPSAARLSGPGGVAIGGGRLIVADTENHRVLVWSTIPTASGAAANLVLGQSSFNTNRPNRGRVDGNGDSVSDVGADGVFYPIGVASDGTRLFVTDQLNHRVLVWNTFPTTNGQAADAALGQADLTSGVANRGSGPFTAVPDGFNLPSGLALVGTSLWVADTENNRVVRWDSVDTAPTAAAFAGQADGSTVSNPNVTPPSGVNVGFPTGTSTTATSVLRPRAVAVTGGKLLVAETPSHRVHILDATTFQHVGLVGQSVATASSPNSGGVSATSINTPAGMMVAGTKLWVADSGNHRVLGYDAASLPNTGAAANVVIGQASLLSSGFNASSSAAGSVVSGARGLARFGNSLYVADTGHHRVLVLNAPPMSGDKPTRVFGQPDDKLALPNSGGAASARSLNSPASVYADAQHVMVADGGNHRVLVWDATSPNADASLVLGQANFTAMASNAGGATASTMSAPAGVYFDGTRLYVADSGNHRVLVWNAFPTQNGQAADLVLGQDTFDQVSSNRGNAAPAANTLAVPAGVVLVNGNLIVADSGNNRIVVYDAPRANGVAAKAALGQPDLTSRTAAAIADDLTKLAGPVALAFDGSNVYVVDRDLARVVVYAADATSGSSASFIVGGTGGSLSMANPGGVAAERTPLFTSRLYIADSGKNRIANVSSVSRLLE